MAALAELLAALQSEAISDPLCCQRHGESSLTAGLQPAAVRMDAEGRVVLHCAGGALSSASWASWRAACGSRRT